MTTTNYYSLTERLVTGKIISTATSDKIKLFLQTVESKTRWQLLMILCGLIGAGFSSAGIFAIISHNWDDFPKIVRGILSLIPTLVALYFYYLGITKHKKSRVWAESSALFLMMMIGASISLVDQTYQISGEGNMLVVIWLALSVPLFYINNSSGIALVYLPMALYLTSDISFGFLGVPIIAEGSYQLWYWFFIAAFVPHAYLNLNKTASAQGVRMVFLAYVFGITFLSGSVICVESSPLFWMLGLLLAYYLIGKKYYGTNSTFWTRPLQTLTILVFSYTAVAFSVKYMSTNVFNESALSNIANWEWQNYFYTLLSLSLIVISLYYYWSNKSKFKNINKLTAVFPILVVFAWLIEPLLSSNSWWVIRTLFMVYTMVYCAYILLKGSDSGNTGYMVYGVVLLMALMILKYMDLNWNFIIKGLYFIGVGGAFFLINYFVQDEIMNLPIQGDATSSKPIADLDPVEKTIDSPDEDAKE